MAAPDIDDAFVRQYESEVHAYFQRQGSKLMNSVRMKSGVVGMSTTFQTYGTATATQKTRNGDVAQSNPAHAPIEVTLSDWYVQIPIDKLDELKINHNEREEATRAGAAALGQKIDEQIITALAETTRFVGTYAAGVTSATLAAAVESFWSTDIPEDGQSYGVLSNHAWQEFKSVSRVSSSDFVGDLYPWLKGRKAYEWDDIVWMHHTGLPLANTDDRDCYLYHKSAVALAFGQPIVTDIWWDGRSQSHLVTLKMSSGAKLIDERGVVEWRLDDDTAIS
jgi:hypothetical protein